MRNKLTRGYTLIELVVAVGLFALVMTLASGAYLLMMDLNRQTQDVATGVNSLSFALETMTRNIRTGTAYSCGVYGSGDCLGGDEVFSFKDVNGTIVTYARGTQGTDSAGSITENGVVLTDPTVNITGLTFYVSGTETVASGDYLQPRVTIVVSGTASSRVGKTSQSFTIETGSTLRGVDLTVVAPPATPTVPVCVLTANPTAVLSGGKPTLSWTTKNAKPDGGFSINQDIGTVSPSAGGSTPAASAINVTTIYVGTVTNSIGKTATCSATVTVTPQ